MEIIKKQPKNGVHPYIPELQEAYRKGDISRREFMRYATLLGLSVGAASALAACGGGATPTAAPAAPTAVPPTSAPAAVAPTKAPEPTKAPAPTAAPAGPKRGGTATIATRVQRVDHPARLSWIEGANQLRQVCEYLTLTGYDNITVPWLLEKWEASADVKEWTLYLRKGIKFNNGQELTTDDVMFNFKQWLDKAVGSSMLGLIGGYISMANIEKVDNYTLKLHCTTPHLAVPEDMFHYPALIVPKTFEGDITKQPIGTGPFKMDKYVPTERAEFSRREDYWKQAPDGKPFPYMDKLVYLDLGQDTAAQIAALQSGQVDNIFNPPAEIWQATKGLPSVKVYAADTAQTWVIRMRVDQKPFSDNKVRQALKMCIDRQKMLDLAWFGEGVLAHDAHVAPIHPEYCKKDIPKYDPAGAKALLAEAGYPNGLDVELSTQEARAEPAMAQSLKETAAAAGFRINLKILPSAQYWDIWTEVPLGITIWAHRPLGTMALALAYTAGDDGKPGAWNETRWVDKEFSDLLKQADQTLDVAKRRDIMCKLEDIQQQRGSVGIAFYSKVWNIWNKKFKNVAAHPTNYDLFTDMWYDASA